jgi:hypothetical protein
MTAGHGALAAAAGPQKKEDECIPDKLFMALCLSLCVNTLVLGLHQVGEQQQQQQQQLYAFRVGAV